MLSLVVQFCRGTSREVALVVLGLLPTSVRDTSVLSRLMEAALQAYLNNVGIDASADLDYDFVAEPMSVLGAAIASQPSLSIADAIGQCMGQQAPLTLRLLLSLQLSTLEHESHMVFMPVALDAIKSAATCRVPAAREFELLPLWFYVIEVIASDSWLTEYSAAADSLQAFSKSVQTACGLISGASLWDAFGTEAPPPLQSAAMQLAGRALLLYLNHAVLAKQQGALRSIRSDAVSISFASGPPELKAQTAALLKCAQQTAYRSGFESFFNGVDALTTQSMPVTLPAFKRHVVRTLLPMAPYLHGL